MVNWIAVSAAPLVLCAVLIRSAAGGAAVQEAALPARMVDVDGRAMRVAVAGLEQRAPGQPVIVLEAGANETGIEEWTSVFPALAGVAPVLAYDRRGVGQSEPDVEKVTLRRTAQSLHALLQSLTIPPPYVLVGHSWGGLVARAYVDQFPGEVAGLVFLDALSPGMTREEKARRLPPEEREAALAPPVLPPIPPDTPPGLRAEYELIGSEMVNDYPEARSLRPPAGVPIAMVKAAPPGRLASLGEGISIRETELAGLALRSPGGVVVAAAHVGHKVQRDDPAMVVWLVEHVLRSVRTLR